MGRINIFRIHMQMAFRRAGRAFKELIFPREYDPTMPSTADWHQPPSPDHPSLLCRCPEGGNGHWAGHHLDNCPWLAAMCKTCEGTGWCPGCGGDGCDPQHDPTLLYDEPDVLAGNPDKLRPKK